MRTILALILLMPAAAAHGHSVELTPFVGFRFASDLTADLGFLGVGVEDLEVDQGSSLGVSLAFPVVGDLQVELLVSRQESELVAAGGLFGRDLPLFDLDVTYYQAGLLWEWGHGRARPYLAFGVGAAELDPDFPDLSAALRPAANAGVGVKLYFSQHLGLRVEGRGYWVLLDEDADEFCGRRFRRRCLRDDFYQAEVNAGLLISW